jgi:predicted DsbA family dithiol-disulfide isomerase
MEGPARIRIDAWSDYACPHCRAQWRVLETLVRDGDVAIELEWHAFQLSPASRFAFEAAEFARDAGQFADMHRALFFAVEQGRDVSKTEVLAELAGSLGLDGAALLEALEANRYTARVVADESRGAGLGIRSVPMLLVRRDGMPITEARGVSGAAQASDLRRVIDRVTSS